MHRRSQEVLIDVSTAAMDTGGYGVLLTITSEGGSEVSTAFSYLGTCSSLHEARNLAEIFAKSWVAENISL